MKKPFRLQARYIGPKTSNFSKLFEGLREWHLYGKYRTEKDREQALENLQRKDSCWEYRIETKTPDS